MTLLTAAVLAIALLQATAGPDDKLAAPTTSAEVAGVAPVAATPTPATTISGGDSESAATSIGRDLASMIDSVAALAGQATFSGPVRTTPPSGSAVYSSASITVVGDVRYAGGQALDIYVPNGPGPHPAVVLIRGGPSGDGGRSYLSSFARGLASTGLLVFNADYRDIAAAGGGSPAAFRDVACAIRFARVQAAHYNGDSSRVTLIGHSLGGWVGSVVALDDKEFTGGCPTGGSGRPDAFVGLAGNYDLGAGGGVARDLERFFGGSASTTAAARAASDPFAYAKGSKIPIRLVVGTADGTVGPSPTIKLNTWLAKRGWNVVLTLVPGGTHMSILWSSYKGGSFGAVFSAIAAARSKG